MVNYKAKFVWALRHIFEDDGKKIDEEVSEEFGISKSELNPRKYKKDNHTEIESKPKESQTRENKPKGDDNNGQDNINGSEDFSRQSNRQSHHEEVEVGNKTINGNPNVVNINDYKKEEKVEYEVRDGDDSRVKRLITVLREELENKYKTIKIGVNFDETKPYQINFQVVSYDNSIQLEFSIYYIYDMKNNRYIYQQDRVSRVEAEDSLKKMFGKNNELNHILDSYVRAVKLNYTVGKDVNK